ncbi:hypothetical protein [Kineococcus sp. R86509]|uniref:hypothetical protein n=1 Tax=Kineococcus sp. R86509 TaxID=3093851 RepID=UPI0036D2B18B
MIVRVGDDGSVTVEHVEVLDRFHVEASGLTVAAVVAALESAGAGTGHSAEHVAVEPGFLRLAAGTSASEHWQRGFDGMLGHARSKGWVDEAGRLLAHVEHLG